MALLQPLATGLELCKFAKIVVREDHNLVLGGLRAT